VAGAAALLLERHPDGCPCPGCVHADPGGYRFADSARRDAAVLGWAAGYAEGVLHGAHPGRAEDRERLATDLTGFCWLMLHAEAMLTSDLPGGRGERRRGEEARREDGGADEPTVVPA
jgi:hypothetical protein